MSEESEEYFAVLNGELARRIKFYFGWPEATKRSNSGGPHQMMKT
jgi:hypothetical protein